MVRELDLGQLVVHLDDDAAVVRSFQIKYQFHPGKYRTVIQNAASVTIPAGTTTWGKVFIANGLQLIIAILLIVLGLIIVVNSAKSYAKSEKNSEKAA